MKNTTFDSQHNPFFLSSHLSVQGYLPSLNINLSPSCLKSSNSNFSLNVPSAKKVVVIIFSFVFISSIFGSRVGHPVKNTLMTSVPFLISCGLARTKSVSFGSTILPTSQNFLLSNLFKCNNFAEDPRKNNILACTGEARKAALDFRLINPNVEDFEQSKVNKMVKNVLTHYKDTKYERNTQLIFCDLGVSKENSQKIDINKPTISEFSTIEDIAKHYNLEQRPRYEEEIDKDGNKTGLKIEIGYEWVQYDKDKKGKDENRKIKKVYTTEEVLDIFGNNFDVYSDILKKLVKSGIPQNQIAFIGDAKNDKAKQALFDKVNDGVIRVLIGSTEKMGAGTNVQQRVVAMHELDCPWRPADLEQRLGRVVRQGNLFFDLDKENFEISHYRYSTEQTYDARMFQINEQKLKPLIQIKKSEFLQNQRTFDGIDSELLNISEMKAYATGNPFILEKHKIKGFLDREEKAKEYFYKTKANVERELESAFIEKNRLQEKLEVLQEMLANRGFDKDIYELELFKGLHNNK